jgi:hypothetical protein
VKVALKKKPTIRFKAIKLDPLFEVLGAVAFMESLGTNGIAQYANIDPRTVALPIRCNLDHLGAFWNSQLLETTIC